MRSIFTSCTNKLLSAQNWGNSGVKILGAKGYEVQIMDSYGMAAAADPSVVLMCAGQTAALTTGDVCGAIYHTRGPILYPELKPSANSPGASYQPDGEWNRLEIGFMAARYKLDPDSGNYIQIKCSTISVIINDIQVHHRIGLAPRGWSGFDEQARLICDSVYDEPDDPKNYCKASGIILLQEHDTPVQFRAVQINPTWLPGAGTSFDRGWQRDTVSGCLART